MKITNCFFTAFILVLSAFFVSCEQEDPIEKQEVTPTSGAFILNQGSWGQNNSGISYYDFTTGNITADILNGRLGDTAQDLIIYGGKIYVSVTESSVIWALSLSDLRELAVIQVKDGDKPRKPNYLAAYSDKVYATTVDGNVIRIDTANLTIDGIAAVGNDPEGIVIADGKLYVGNTNGLNYPNYDNTLSVIDLATFKEALPRIEVGLNPNRLKTDGHGNIYLTYRGDYGSVSGGFQKLDLATKTVINIDIPANQDFTIVDDTLYYFGITYNEDYSANNIFGKYDVKNDRLIAGYLISDDTSVGTAYALGIDPYNKDIYIADTDYFNPSKIHIFDRNGKKKFDFQAGLNAYKIIFR
ncbi:MAG: hypothetical protein LBR13_03275 [Dysgonamonadaceae bacterium]|jgi:outer membrane protein assembly factor BamB|nr:hypothetical protein [Dysgonamonadaceae bacterium]